MRKAIIVLLLVTLCFGISYAQNKRNSYQITSFANTTTQRTKTITFPFETNELTIINNDANDSIGVRIDGIDGVFPLVFESEGTFILGPAQNITFYDYATTGITLIGYQAEASPVSVIANY